MSAVDEQIEFIDLVDDGAAVTVETVATSEASFLRMWPLLVVAGFAALLIFSGGGADDAAPVLSEPDPTPMPTVAPISPGAMAGVERPETVRVWPSPPRDRDPYVVRIPANDVEPVGSLGRTMVYINTLGDPTVVSLVTGDVFEIDVAPIRIHETFAVEDGEVRSLEGANPALPDATGDAVIFHTYRATDPPGVGTVAGELSPPELCLSGASCRTAEQGVARRLGGGVVVERFDADSHADVAQVLGTWAPVDRWLVSPDGHRIPTPVDLVWVITPLGESS